MQTEKQQQGEQRMLKSVLQGERSHLHATLAVVLELQEAIDIRFHSPPHSEGYWLKVSQSVEHLAAAEAIKPQCTPYSHGTDGHKMIVELI